MGCLRLTVPLAQGSQSPSPDASLDPCPLSEPQGRPLTHLPTQRAEALRVLGPQSWDQMLRRARGTRAAGLPHPASTAPPWLGASPAVALQGPQVYSARSAGKLHAHTLCAPVTHA